MSAMITPHRIPSSTAIVPGALMRICFRVGAGFGAIAAARPADAGQVVEDRQCDDARGGGEALGEEAPYPVHAAVAHRFLQEELEDPFEADEAEEQEGW